jgi:hypothetical protein
MVLKMLVYAANPKGKSDPVVVEGFTLKVAEKQTGECYLISQYTVFCKRDLKKVRAGLIGESDGLTTAR